jgi:hypothetical protein
LVSSGALASSVVPLSSSNVSANSDVHPVNHVTVVGQAYLLESVTEAECFRYYLEVDTRATHPVGLSLCRPVRPVVIGDFLGFILVFGIAIVSTHSYPFEDH